MAALPSTSELLDISQDSSEYSSDSSDSSDSDSDTSSIDSDSENEAPSQDFLNSLLEKARSKTAKGKAPEIPEGAEMDEIVLDSEPAPIPPLNPGKLPESYFHTDDTSKAGPSRLRDPDIERAERAVLLAASMPAPPDGPPELTKSGKPLTKRQKKELKQITSGPDWFDMAAPAEEDLPRLYREVEAMRLRNHLDPKRFFRKDEGEGKGIKGLPKYFAMGTVVTTKTPFGGATGENLTKAERKRSLVDELMDDADAKRYAKKKWQESQRTKGSRGRNTLHAKQAARKPKW